MDDPILALEGALGPFSVALVHGERSWRRSVTGNAALEDGLAIVEGVLAEAGLRLEALGGLAVGIGPGGFTGLRIAISYAKSLALGAGLPLTGVSSFDLLDAAAGAEGQIPRLTVISGRPGVACMRRTDAGGSAVGCGPTEETLSRLVPSLDERFALVSTTEDDLKAVGERVSRVQWFPAISDSLALVLARMARNRAPASSLHALAPDYGELPAATLKVRA